ncbi:MAG: C4-type zinc ribbon domain-containing protein [Nocardioides sp.]|nr:C4-type zinc ribbon domain-containing protein [Nocardioides sp.]
MKLLEVAQIDSKIGQLRHQLRALPEHKQIAEIEANRTEQVNATRDAQILVDDLTREQKKADADVEQVKARRQRDLSRIDQGLITNPKDLQRMNQELVSLERRISSLEDDELDVMERLEAAQKHLDHCSGELAESEARLAEFTESRDGKGAGLKEEFTAATTQRASAIEGLPEDLLGLYERIREKQGVGAAALRARECGGCHMKLNAADLAVIARAPEDEVVRCEECTRILVRTAESGL